MNFMVLGGIIVSAIWLLQPAHSAMLNGPFPATIPNGIVNADELASCDQPPQPVTALGTASRYKPDDPTKSEVDDERSEAYEAAVKPLREFQSTVVGWANDAIRKSDDLDKAGCALNWLAAWAQGNALSQLSTGQAEFNRDQALSALGLAYLQVRAVTAGDGSAQGYIAAWMGKQASEVVAYYENEAGEMSRSNNHSYFAALGVAAVAVVNNDHKSFGWSMDLLHAALCQATPEGALPMEMKRGARARDYQIFALGPLVMLAEFAEANGIDAYSDCNGALPRIVDFAMNSRNDPSEVAKLAGAEQIPLDEDKDKARLAWLVPYVRRFPASPWAGALQDLEKASSTALGGNMRVLFP